MGLLVRWHTTTKVVSNPWQSLGKLQKSIDMSQKVQFGIGRGFKSPGCLSQGFLAWQHSWQFHMYHVMSFLQPGQ